MPVAKVQMPDGRIGRFDVPEGTTPQQVEAFALEQLKGSPKRTDDINLDPTAGNSFGQNALIGAGKFTQDIVDATKQRLRLGDQKALEASISERRQIDKPLMNTVGGNVGYVAPALATALIPGANTLTGAALIGGATGALQPTVGDESVMGNIATNAALGGVGQKVGQVVGDAITSKVGGRVAARAGAQSANSVRDATLREAADAGYVLPPSAVDGGGFLSKRMESIAGKDALRQAASVKNQQTTNALARRALGIADDAPLTEGAIDAVRQSAGAAYQDVASLSPKAAYALDKLKEARFDSKTYWNHYNRSGDPASLKTARTLDQKVSLLDRTIEKEAKVADKPELVAALREARALIAKSYDVEKALNVATGDVSARTLGAALDKGRPLTGELATIGKFSEGFGQYAKEGAKVPTPGVSKVEAMMAAALGAGGGAAMGPGGIALAALPLVSTPVRNALLKPRGAVNYRAPLAERLAGGAAANEKLSKTLQALLPGAYAATEQER